MGTIRLDVVYDENGNPYELKHSTTKSPKDYKIGDEIELLDNSFEAIKTKFNSTGDINKESLCLSKIRYSEYYRVCPGEQNSKFTITEIDTRVWRNNPRCSSGLIDNPYTLRTLTIQSDITGKEYYIGLWNKVYYPNIINKK